MKSRKLFIVIAMAFALTFIPLSATVAQDEHNELGSWSIPALAVAPLLDADGNQVGTVAVGNDAESGLGLMLIIEGLPEGTHGIHMHEAGVCESADDKDFGAAGGHFNPGGMTHPNHGGDLGNLEVPASGNAILMAGLGVATFDDGEWGLADADGTALVIHETVDDLATDPSGNSGARIACAVLAAPVV
jgi:superoxide dismutase, Cu-Zn family